MVTRARMFTYKPDGDVTLTKSQDAHGLPAPLMQDPIHYPHGTKFMAPGAIQIPADDSPSGLARHYRLRLCSPYLLLHAQPLRCLPPTVLGSGDICACLS